MGNTPNWITRGVLEGGGNRTPVAFGLHFVSSLHLRLDLDSLTGGTSAADRIIRLHWLLIGVIQTSFGIWEK